MIPLRLRSFAVRPSRLLSIAAAAAIAGHALAVGPAFAAPGEAPDSSAAADSAKSKESKWDVANPPGPRTTLEFEATQGAWISVDVHPRGHLLVFDVLGDIYTVPIGGGDATLVSGGIPYEIQPRFSPDGTKILFTSDRAGGENAWIMDADGTDPVQVTKESFRLENNAVWHPSGEWIVAKKHFTSRRSMGAGELWMYRVPNGNVEDGGEGVQLTKKKNEQQDVGEPEISPDGRFVYWSEDMSPGPFFQYNKDPNGVIYMIRRLELATGEITDVIDVPGGAVRPQISPDGGTLAFVRRVRTKSVLSLFDLATREIRPLWDGLDEDQQETWSLFGVYPGFDWTPDGRAIVISARGGLWRVDAKDGTPREIPFRCRVAVSVADALRFPQSIGGATFPVKAVRSPQVTADGAAIFPALGGLHRLDAGATRPRRLAGGRGAGREEIQAAPSLSRDGRSVVYVTWSDREGGRVKSCDANGGRERVIVAQPGHYVFASWSPDGRSIAVERAGADSYRGRLWANEPGIYVVDAAGGALRRVTREGSRPRFSKDGQRLFLLDREGSGDEAKAALVSVNLLGGDRRVHATSTHATDMVLSPDERWIAFEELWDVYVAPFPISAKSVALGPTAKSVPVRKLSKGGGTYVSWSADSKRVHWSLGPELFTAEVAQVYVKKDSAAGGDSLPSFRGEAADVRRLGWDAPADVPPTDLWLAGATVLPMDDLSVIRDGVVHVKGNRIAAVGTRAELPPPPGANVVDVTGKTLLPGLVDVHAHTGSADGGLHPQQNWAFLAPLAFGVTSTHDPSNDSPMIFAESERVKSGTLLGPRIFSTGTILYGAEGNFKTVIDEAEDAIDAVHRTAAWGAFSVKSYNQPRREQRQMVIEAGRKLGVMVVPEGGSTLQNNLTHLIDGHTTIEHSIPVAPLYDPELRLLSRFGTGYTPTLIVGYGGIWGENYWYHVTNVWENERLLHFVPRSVVDPRSRRRVMAPEEEYHHFALAETAAEVVHRGGNVQLGAHGQMQGIGAHWELWMFAQGGMTNHEALRAGTWMGARALGLDGELGSVRAGKLADLVVVDGDPLANLRVSENVLYTMVNGRLYDARTLAQLAPERRPPPAWPDVDGGEAPATCLCGGGAVHAH